MKATSSQAEPMVTTQAYGLQKKLAFILVVF
jgi:hypothetical protein